jgi:hypothetical protein
VLERPKQTSPLCRTFFFRFCRVFVFRQKLPKKYENATAKKNKEQANNPLIADDKRQAKLLIVLCSFSSIGMPFSDGFSRFWPIFSLPTLRIENHSASSAENRRVGDLFVPLSRDKFHMNREQNRFFWFKNNSADVTHTHRSYSSVEAVSGRYGEFSVDNGSLDSRRR